MEIRTIKHQIANIRRHYGINGNDMLACYDTAITALIGQHQIPYVTVSVAPSRWKALSDRLDLDVQVKHPGSGVPCLKVFENVYIRSEHFIKDDDVEWSNILGIYTPTAAKLMAQQEAVTLASKSTKRQIEYANHIMTRMLVHPDLKKAKVK